MFVPIANLFRNSQPCGNSARRIRGRAPVPAGAWSKSAPISGATVGLAVWLLLGGGFMRTWGNSLPSLENGQSENFARIIESYREYLMGYSVFTVGLTLIIVLYLNSTLRATDRFLHFPLAG